jgi:hypothetical protein
MAARKYQNIKVSDHVNVSSSFDYHFKVWWKGGHRDYSLGVGFLTNHKYNAYTWEGAPKYLEAEVERQIATMFRDGTAKFYEYDRDGNTRYENLRYYDAEQVASWAKTLGGNHNEA